MKEVSCVDHLCSVNLVKNVQTVAPDLPVGARLHQFWEKWAASGASPKVVTVLRKSYTFPFRFRPSLTRSPTVTHKLLKKSPHCIASVSDKKCSGTGSNSKITGFLQETIFSPQTQQPVETYLGPGHLKQLFKHSRSKWRHQRQ